MRRGELAGLRWGDWNRNTHSISVARTRQSVDAHTETLLARWKRRRERDGHPVDLDDAMFTNTEGLFRNLTIHTGVVNVAAYMRKLMPMVESGQLDSSVIFTDTLPLADAVEGYDRMMNRNPGTIKVALTN